MLDRRARTVSLGLAAAALLVTAGVSSDAEARRRPNIKRKGGQYGIIFGGAACIPGKAECARDNVSDGGVTIDGRTRPSFGMGAELGYRFNRYVFAGAAYNLGFFDTSYEVSGADNYRRGFQNSVFGVVRPTLPVWRFDFGLGLGPGFSRQTFVHENGDKDYSQGFAFKLAPTIDIFLTRRVFLGAKLDLILNGHRRTCAQTGNTTNCVDTGSTDLAPVHQMVFGLHVGGTFM
ncbi:MAG: hypothetical protein K0V04_34135 [Deltaproteobacteria bacterium]|nr:hypothetical protein [Deltaproteobacteria bacterium]